MEHRCLLLLTLARTVFGCGTKAGEITGKQQIFDSYEEAKAAIEKISDEFHANVTHAVSVLQRTEDHLSFTYF